MSEETLKLCMNNGFLLDKEMLGLFSNFTVDGVREIIWALKNLEVEERVITKSLFQKHFEKFKNLLVREIGIDKTNNFFNSIKFTGEVKNKRDIGLKNNISEGKNSDSLDGVTGKVKLISAPAFPQKKIEVKDFVRHFQSRYEAIKRILEEKNFDNLTSIRKIGFERGNYTIIAIVFEKRITKNKNIFLRVEDMTGRSIVLVNQNRKEVFEKAKDLLADDIVAFKVSGNKDMLFADDITYPEASLSEKRYSKFDEYIAFLGDLHAGSTMFLEKNILKFVKWLNGEGGDNNQKEIAKKVKYLFFTGDTVDGVNHYPGQEKYLSEKTVLSQYGVVESILKLIRKDVQIIICPGQHDSVWVGEPQPIIPEDHAPGLHSMENVHMVPNPSLIEIDGDFRILLYHGASINPLINELPKIRTQFGHSSPTKVVKELMKRRHLAPMHGLVDYIPCEKDPMVINKIPDIVATGDQHRAEVLNYNNILLITGSCWQSITPFEEKVGNVPDPCKVPLFNLKTREIKILDFSDEENEVIAKNLLKKKTKFFEKGLKLNEGK
tara:strand:- start:7380 stop:9029 length:1650 start_codon:yes stop_codon:yes gene_type:complete